MSFCGRRTMLLNDECYDISGKTLHEIEKLQNKVNKKVFDTETKDNDISIDGGVGTANNSDVELNKLLKKLKKLQKNKKSIKKNKKNKKKIKSTKKKLHKKLKKYVQIKTF